MAGTAQYTAVLDANVLYPALLRDVLLSLAHADLYSAKWSIDIRDEWTKHLVGKHPSMEEKIRLMVTQMELAIPDCIVMGYEHLIDGLNLPDRGDRHVLAAAIAGHADAIVTWNEKDFPEESLAPFGIEVQSPDEFVLNQIMLDKVSALSAIKRMRERWERPEYDATQLVALLEKRGLPQTAAHLRDVVALI